MSSPATPTQHSDVPLATQYMCDIEEWYANATPEQLEARYSRPLSTLVAQKAIIHGCSIAETIARTGMLGKNGEPCRRCLANFNASCNTICKPCKRTGAINATTRTSRMAWFETTEAGLAHLRRIYTVPPIIPGHHVRSTPTAPAATQTPESEDLVAVQDAEAQPTHGATGEPVAAEPKPVKKGWFW